MLEFTCHGFPATWAGIPGPSRDPLGFGQLRAVHAVGARGAEVDPKETIVLAHWLSGDVNPSGWIIYDWKGGYIWIIYGYMVYVWLVYG